MADELPSASDQFVQSLARGLSVILAFDHDHPSLTLSEVAQRTGLARAVARRLLLTLESLGYVRSNGRQYELTGLVLELGYAYLSTQPLAQLATPYLEELAKKTGESSSITVLDEGDILHIARVHRRRIMRVSIHIGTRFPAFCTAMGRVMLADLSAQQLDEFFDKYEIRKLTPHTMTSIPALRKELAKVREQGWCLVDQELELGLRSVAVPIRDDADRVVAAINVPLQVGSTDTPAIIAKQVKHLVPLLKDTAEQMRHVATRFKTADRF